MKIGFDVQSMHGKPTGLGYYTSQLLAYVQGKSDAPECLQYSCERELNVPGRLWWENVALRQHVYRDKLDIFHVTGFAGPYKLPCRKITTVHDLIGLLFPENLNFASRQYWARWLPRCARTSDFIITDSYHSKKDIAWLLGYPEGRIKVIYLAAGKEYSPVADKAACRAYIAQAFGIEENIILSAGTIEPRKNFSTLVKAYNLLPDSIKKNHRLVFVGKKGWDFVTVNGLVQSLDLEKRVVFLDYVSTYDLKMLYNAASAFVFPSFYEGFGLPVLEAMSCGAPVVTSEASSLREIAGQGALLFEAYDFRRLKELLEEILESSSLRQELSEKGVAQARMFTWEKTAAETMDVYKRVYDVKV